MDKSFISNDHTQDSYLYGLRQRQDSHSHSLLAGLLTKMFWCRSGFVSQWGCPKPTKKNAKTSSSNNSEEHDICWAMMAVPKWMSLLPKCWHAQQPRGFSLGRTWYFLATVGCVAFKLHSWRPPLWATTTRSVLLYPPGIQVIFVFSSFFKFETTNPHHL